MISRIFVALRGLDTREGGYLRQWRDLGLRGMPTSVKIVDSYLIQSKLSKAELEKVADALSNPISETSFIDDFPIINHTGNSYVVEVGFRPGVTDNVAHSARETILDLLRLSEHAKLEIYTSKVFIISGKSKSFGKADVEKIVQSLHNPLIERSFIQKIKKGTKLKLPMTPPEVVLPKRASVISVALTASDEELSGVGKSGILDPDGSYRGPLALSLDSMKVIKAHFEKLGRNPTDIELESLAQTWSEHCKHTIFANPIDLPAQANSIKEGLYRTYIKGATKTIRKNMGRKDFCVSVFSDNAGSIVFDDEYLVTHKVETHNSPSALDPFGGAITGIVGVNRDTIGFGLGAKPVANTYGFCLGYPDDKTKYFKDEKLSLPMLPPRRIMEGVIKGINIGGNTSGIPTLSGFVRFDDRYRAKPMVFAGTIGLIPKKVAGKPSHIKKAEPGDYIVVVGGRVGLDGIHGATFSSVKLDSSSPIAAVQIGDPITQKKLSDAIVKEARDMNLYNSITDNGAGGLSCSISEMARDMRLPAGGQGGAKVKLEKVPLKYPGLRPWEIWISESQERMTLAVPRPKWTVFHSLMQSRGVEATVVGEFTDSGKCIVMWRDKKIMDLEMQFLHDGMPTEHLVAEESIRVHPEPKLPNGNSRTKELENLLGNLNIGGYSFISEQYDHEVQASKVIGPISGAGRINTDAQVFRPVLNSDKGVVISYGLYPSYSDIDTYHMAACSLDTAVRNVVSAGGTLKHLAILDNFCWCSSYDKSRLWELVRALQACYKYAVGYGTPFISGKDSMFNDFHGYDEKGYTVNISIPPTLLISAISVMPEMRKAMSPEFKNHGDNIYLLGETHDELGGSEYFKSLGKKGGDVALGNAVPNVDLEKNLKTYQALEKAIEGELVTSALSLTGGGLAVAMAKACVGGMLGCNVDIGNLPGEATSVDAKLFSESQGRILVSVAPEHKASFEKIMKNISCEAIGQVNKDKKVVAKDGKSSAISTNIDKLYKLYHKFSNSQK